MLTFKEDTNFTLLNFLSVEITHINTHTHTHTHTQIDISVFPSLPSSDLLKMTLKWI